jgi:hypothetical protein
MARTVNNAFGIGIVAVGGSGKITDAAGADEPFPSGSDPFGADTFFAQLGLDQAYRATRMANAATMRQRTDSQDVSESVRKSEMNLAQTDEVVSSFQLLVGKLEYDLTARADVVLDLASGG